MTQKGRDFLGSCSVKAAYAQGLLKNLIAVFSRVFSVLNQYDRGCVTAVYVRVSPCSGRKIIPASRFQKRILQLKETRGRMAEQLVSAGRLHDLSIVIPNP